MSYKAEKKQWKLFGKGNQIDKFLPYVILRNRGEKNKKYHWRIKENPILEYLSKIK